MQPGEAEGSQVLLLDETEDEAEQFLASVARGGLRRSKADLVGKPRLSTRATAKDSEEPSLFGNVSVVRTRGECFGIPVGIAYAAAESGRLTLP